MKKNKFKKLITCLIVMSAVSLSAQAVMMFDDIPVGFWAYQEIDTLERDGILFGYPNNLFEPDKDITRAEYASIVIRALGQENIPIETMYSFEDVDSSFWAWNYIIRAVNLGIIKPADDGYFYPQDGVTKTEVITFLVNLLKSEDITKEEAIKALQNTYTDFDDIPDWFKETAGKALILGVIPKSKDNNNRLDCEKYVTRAELAVFAARMKEKTASYVKEKMIEEQSPKISEGIIIDNTIRSGDIVTLPEQTVLPVTIIGQISTKDAYPGQMFKAKFADNIVDYEHHTLLSKDIILIGKVLDSECARYILRNGELIFELSGANKNGMLSKIQGVAEYQAEILEANKLKKIYKTIIKGRNFTANDGQILYIRLFQPLRVNIVTGEIL